ncbi:MAG: YihY/virulence factor BrkB family protein [Thiogranum sp.]|nr:YihY/virulence factor BrkB family protein [Thiogranum sp.]
MSNQLQQLYERSAGWLWSDKLRNASRVRHSLVMTLRIVFVLVRQLMQGQLNLRAMSLVYTTLLSLVPLLAFSFSVLKGFGVHNQLEPALLGFFEPLGPEGAELTQRIIGFVDRVDVGVLGSLGLGFLLYTVVSLTQKVEESFNFVWQVDRLRSFAERFSSYLSVIMIGPVLVFTALGVTATVMNTSLVQELMEVEPFGHLIVLASKLIPYVLVIAAFTFVYMFVPNTRVKLAPAAIGGLVAGVLWQASGWGFAAFIASSSKYAAIYSGFAILILMLIWLYIGWLILLLGAQVAFYVQHSEYVTREPVQLRLSNRLQEHLVLQIMFLVADNYIKQRDPWTLDELVQHLGLPMQPIHRVLRLLVDSGVLSETGGEPPAYLPRRDIDTITVAALLDVARSAGETRMLAKATLPYQAQVAGTMETIRKAVEAELGEQTLRDLVTQSHAADSD